MEPVINSVRPVYSAKVWEDLRWVAYLSRDDFFRFNWFQLFSCEKEILKIAGHGQNRSKMTFCLRGCIWFQLFSLIFNYFIFYSESSLFKAVVMQINLIYQETLCLCQINKEYRNNYHLSCKCTSKKKS
jgi:hypothetical protein